MQRLYGNQRHTVPLSLGTATKLHCFSFERVGEGLTRPMVRRLTQWFGRLTHGFQVPAVRFTADLRPKSGPTSLHGRWVCSWGAWPLSSWA